MAKHIRDFRRGFEIARIALEQAGRQRIESGQTNATGRGAGLFRLLASLLTLIQPGAAGAIRRHRRKPPAADRIPFRSTTCIPSSTSSTRPSRPRVDTWPSSCAARPTTSLVVMDLQTNEKKAITRIEARAGSARSWSCTSRTVYWKTDERLLFRVTVRPDEGLVLQLHVVQQLDMLGDRLFAVNRDGSKLVAAARRQPQCRARRRVRSRRHHEFPAQGSAAHPHGAGWLQRPQPVQGGSRHRHGRADRAAQRERGRLVARCRWQSGGSRHWLRAAPYACFARTRKASGRSSTACAYAR